MPSATPPLILPIEGQSRELDAKLLLACVAAERGFPAILGAHKAVNFELARIPRGIYLAKDLRKSKRTVFKILDDLGHVVAAGDEESLVRFSGEADYYRRRLSPLTARFVSHLFSWGEDDARIFRNYPHLAGTRIHATGNPRMDLLRPEVRGIFDPDVAEIRERYGPFILINTNFDHANKRIVTSKSRADGSPDAESELILRYARHQQALFDAFAAAIPKLASEFSDFTIVLRPHPGEDPASWLPVASDHPNVRVVHENCVAPWLMAAETVIHNGCTTAIEAVVLGKVPVAYRPITDANLDFELPNSLSVQTYEIGELCAAVRDVVSGRRSGDASGLREKILDAHVAPRNGPLAADRIVDVLVGAGYLERKLERPSLRKTLPARIEIHRRKRKRVSKIRSGQYQAGPDAFDHRFPGTTVRELQDRIGGLTAQLGRFDRVSVTPVAEQVFRVAV